MHAVTDPKRAQQAPLPLNFDRIYVFLNQILYQNAYKYVSDNTREQSKSLSFQGPIGRLRSRDVCARTLSFAPPPPPSPMKILDPPLVCLIVFLFRSLSLCLSLCLFVCLFIYLFVYLYVCLFILRGVSVFGIWKVKM